MGYIEVLMANGGRLTRDLNSDRVSVGSDPGNDLVISGDATVSGLHLALERYGQLWTLRDLGSTNGTYLNSVRVVDSAVVRPGDEVRIGRTRIMVGGIPSGPRRTESLEAVPLLTARERTVLVELCRPLLDGDIFCVPASVQSIAANLAVTEDAVKKHLARLFDKFDIPTGADNRRTRLANAAVARGAVGLAELRD